MSKMIQIRNVPEDVHATLKARAAKAGTSLSEYLPAEVEQFAKRPTIEEITERIRQLPPAGTDRALARAPGHRARIETFREE